MRRIVTSSCAYRRGKKRSCDTSNFFLRSSVDTSSVGEACSISTDKVLVGVTGGNHVVGVALNPGLGVEPGKNLLEELVGVALSDTKLGDPDGQVEGVVELGEVVLEVLGLVPGVVVGDDEVDLAVAAAAHEGLEPVDSLVGLVGVGDGWRADAETLTSQGLDKTTVGVNGSSDVHVAASATNLVWLVEAQDVRDLVVLAGIGNVVCPGRGAPVLVGVKQRNVFKIGGTAINDSFPVIHPSDFGRVGKQVSPLGSSDAVVLLGKGKTTLAATAGQKRGGLCESR